MNFSGFALLGDTFTDWLQLLDDDGQPVSPDAAPTFRVYGPSGILASAGGTASAGHSLTVQAASNASPIEITTTAAHRLATGQRVTIADVGGNDAANGTWVITRTGDTTFTLNGSTGDGNYTSGGSVVVTGWYKASIVATGGNGFEAGESYAIHYSWAESSASRSEVHGLGVT